MDGVFQKQPEGECQECLFRRGTREGEEMSPFVSPDRVMLRAQHRGASAWRSLKTPRSQSYHDHGQEEAMPAGQRVQPAAAKKQLRLVGARQLSKMLGNGAVWSSSHLKDQQDPGKQPSSVDLAQPGMPEEER